MTTLAALFVAAMLGHFVGDYLLQNEWMALNKSQRGPKGWLPCGVHVLLYTLAVLIFMSYPLYQEGYYGLVATLFDWKLWLIVAVPHYFIDHYSLASYFMRLKNGKKPFDYPKPEDGAGPGVLWYTAFTAPVYIMNDNTIHWVMLYFTCALFLNGRI